MESENKAVLPETDKTTPEGYLCPNCGSPPSEHAVFNHNIDWHDGDVACTSCGAFVRRYDAG